MKDESLSPGYVKTDTCVFVNPPPPRVVLLPTVYNCSAGSIALRCQFGHELVPISYSDKGKVPVRSVKAYRGVGVQLHSFLISGMDGGEGLTSRPGRLFAVPVEQETGLAAEPVQTYAEERNLLFLLRVEQGASVLQRTHCSNCIIIDIAADGGGVGKLQCVVKYISNKQVSPFHRPQRPLGRVEVQLYSVLDLCTRRG